MRERSLGEQNWERDRRELVGRYEMELRERWEQLEKS